MSSQNDVDEEKRRLREIGMAQSRAMVDEEMRSAAQYSQEMNEFNEHLTSIIIPALVNKSNISNTNISSLFNILFLDIPQLNGVALVVPFPTDWNFWPHYKYDEIFSCIEKQYPQITSPKFQGKTYGVGIYVDGKDVREPGAHQRTGIPNEATVELRYRPFAPSKEEVWAAAGLPVDSAYEKLHNLERAAVSSLAPSASPSGADYNNEDDNWRAGEWAEAWDDDPAAPAAPAHAASPVPAPAAPAPAAPATIERVAMALWDTLPPPLSNEDWNGKKQRALKAAAALLDGEREAVLESLAIVLWDTLPPPLSNEDWNGKKQRALKAAAALLDGGDMREHKGPPAPKPQSPMVYPNTGQQTGPFKYGGKKPQSKRGKKKYKSKSKTKKSKRNKRRSYKRVN